MAARKPKGTSRGAVIAHRTIRILLVLLIVLLLLIALLATLLRFGTPYVGRYQSEIQAWVSDYLGTPVELGSMEFDWGPTSPRITISDVRLPGPSGDEGAAVKFRQLWLDLNLPKTLLLAGWHINDVAIVGADLEVEYRGKRDFRVKGLSSGNDSLNPADSQGSRQRETSFAWLLRARQAALLESALTIHDMRRDQIYRFESIDIRAENDGSEHRLIADVDLPASLGESLEVTIDLEADTRDGVVDLDRAGGSVSLQGSGMQIENWLALGPDRGVFLEGSTDLKLQGVWTGRKMNDVRLQLESPAIELAHPQADGEATRLEQLAANLAWQRRREGWQAKVDGLSFLHNGVANDVYETEILVTDTADDRYWKAQFAGRQTSLHTLAVLTAHVEPFLPMGSLAQTLAATRPQGHFTDWRIAVDRGIDNAVAEVPMFTASGLLTGLDLQAYRSIPRLSGVDAQLAIEDNVGSISLKGRQVLFQHPASFPDVLQLESVDGSFDVVYKAQQKRIESSDLIVADRGLDASAALVVDLPSGSAPIINLNAQYSLADATDMTRYVPDARVRKRVSDWLDLAIIKGSVTNGVLQLQGNPAHFPYHREKGVFEASMEVRNAELEFLKSWPRVKKIDGTLSFSRKSMRFDLKRGNMAGLPVQSGTASIESLFRPIVKVQAKGSNTLANMLAFVQQTPLDNIRAALADTEATGDGKLEVKVQVPLRLKRFRQPDEVFDVAGKISFNANRLSSNLYRTTLEKVEGELGFTHQGFADSKLQASYLGRPVQLEAHSSGTTSKRLSEIVFAGVIDSKRVASKHKIPVVSQVRGASAWYLNLEIPHNEELREKQGILLTATSDLRGTALDFPAPFAKTAGSAKRLTLSSAFRPGNSRLWKARLGKEISGLFRVESDSGKLDGMTLRLGRKPVALSDLTQSIRIVGAVNKLRFDRWFESIATLIDELSEEEGGGESAPIPLITANLQANQLLTGSVAHGPARLHVNTDARFVNGVLENSRLRGSTRIPRNAGVVQVRIAKADRAIIESLRDRPESQTGAEDAKRPIDPRKVPPLHVHIGRFDWDALVLKDLVIRTEQDIAGLNITTIGFAQDSAQLTGEGIWHWRDPQGVNAALADEQITELDLQLRSNNVGVSLSNLGFGEAMGEGRGSVSMALNWPGPLYQPGLDSLRGNLQFKLKRGRILKVDPGAARIFGLFALQSIPRRLSLDFSDIVRDGLDYDAINGRVAINDGVATSELVQLRGPVGVIDVTGSTNLLAKTYNQKITVLPRITGALPIIGVLSGGATAGIGALIAGPLLKALGVDLDKIGLAEYSLKGNWDNPVIKQVVVDSIQFGREE